MSPPVRALLDQAEAEPERTVLIDGQERWTSLRLAEQSGCVAAGLAARDVEPGDRVALHMRNTAEAVVGYLACLRLGAVAVPLNTRLATPELNDLVVRTRPKVYLGQHDVYERFAAVPQDLVPGGARFLAGPETASTGGTAPWSDLVAGEAVPTGAEPAPDDPAVLLATSGTTGKPKIAIWSHRTLGALSLSAAGRGIRKDDVLPLMTPLMHSAGVYYLLNCLTQAAIAVLIRQFDAAEVLDVMERTGVTSLFGMPFMYAELTREQRSRPRDVSTLQSAVAAGDVCPARLEADFGRVFGVPLRSFWAATEDVGATIADTRVGPYVKVIPEAQVTVAGPGGRKTEPGEMGELLTSSPTTIPGYWEDAASHTPLPGGVFHSGDLVCELAPGLLQYLGRTKDLIIRGGSNISPHEVEEVLRAHPGIADAAVTGYSDETLGQRVGALVVLAGETLPAPSAEEIRGWARQRLADYKVPERIGFADAIPRNALTKIDRSALGAALESPPT